MNNKSETITGTLERKGDRWVVQSGYGTFPVAEALQSKPASDMAGEAVEATVQHGQVTDYHFTTPQD